MAKMETEKSDISQDKKLIKKAFGMHDKQLHENKKDQLDQVKKRRRDRQSYESCWPQHGACKQSARRLIWPSTA